VEKSSTLRSILGTLRFHSAIVSSALGSDVQLLEGYHVTMESKPAWPIFPNYSDPRAYLMGELHELCGNNFQHIWGVPGESDVPRSVQSMDYSVPYPPPPYMEV
jgi:hypothetical protein